jgi:hypothetical protein
VFSQHSEPHLNLPPCSYLHGGRVLWAIAIICCNFMLFRLSQRCGVLSRSLFVPLMWLVNVLLLFACSWTSGESISVLLFRSNLSKPSPKPFQNPFKTFSKPLQNPLLPTPNPFQIFTPVV